VNHIPFFSKSPNGGGANGGATNQKVAKAPEMRKPKLGIALGAGCARGWAHIGVLLELLSHEIEPEVVAGTSIGALVGGAYAVGKLERMEAFARSLTKRRVMSLMDVSLSGVSFLAGERLRRKLEEEFSGFSFEGLATKFGAVATEFGTGHEVWLTKGSISDAIRTSYTLPGIFEPVKVDGRWLFDGALVNPIPVTLCRNLGAEFVIAVNLSSDPSFRGTTIHDPRSIEPALANHDFGMPEESRTLRARIVNGVSGNLRRVFGRREDGAPGIANAMMDAFNIAQSRISRSRLAGDPPDVLITTRLGNFGLFDFHRADELIVAGREATRRAMPSIIEDIAVALLESVAAPR
jgi:NTE family protein